MEAGPPPKARWAGRTRPWTRNRRPGSERRFDAALQPFVDRTVEHLHLESDGVAAKSDALKESLAQFFPTIQVDRDRFPALDTARSRFVLCTRRMYEAHREDIFEGYYHLETDNPFNVLCSQHEEGLPFIALTYMRRVHDAYVAQIESGRAVLGHPTAELAATLPLLDA